MQKLLLIIIPALWIGAIAILSVQNATPVAIQFLGLQSIELPLGVVLSFCVAGAMLTTAALLLLFSNQRRPQR